MGEGMQVPRQFEATQRGAMRRLDDLGICTDFRQMGIADREEDSSMDSNSAMTDDVET